MNVSISGTDGKGDRITDRLPGLVGLYAVVAAAGSLVVAPLLALAYLSTGEGKEGLESATVSAWADPARDGAGSLLTFASPDRVYATYLQAIALLFPAILLCALAVAARRAEGPQGRAERWGWRIALTGYGLMAIGVLAAAVTLIGASASSAVLNVVFLALMVPGMLVGVLGSSLLGVALIRASYRPRLNAWILALATPLLLVGSTLGHNSLGLVPLFVAWAATGWRLWRGQPVDATERHVGAPG